MSVALSGRTALVTGATRGIGRAIATRLLADGARVIATGRAAKGAPPEGCRYEAVDFADLEASRAFATKMQAETIDILVNNAGINKVTTFADIAEEDFLRIQQVNVTAPFLVTRAVVPGMRARRWGRVVSIGSIWGIKSRAGRAAYSASKFAIDGLMAALAAEAAADGVLVNTVAPGFIDTELTRGILGPEGIAEVLKRVPAGRLGQPDEIAALVAWLVSPDNRYVNGQIIAIDGGFTRA
jgi:NAD(P)-dependent dehydrogenase (short-subunit alcohol dehydrogenase family)